jgi:hypothetical protein
VVMLLLYAVDVMWIRLVLFLFHGLAFVAMLPLQDGFFFSYAEERRRAGETVGAYPTVRLWGTIGFMVPSAIVFFLLRDGGPISRTLLCGFFFGLASLANTGSRGTGDSPPANRAACPRRRLFAGSSRRRRAISAWGWRSATWPPSPTAPTSPSISRRRSPCRASTSAW